MATSTSYSADPTLYLYTSLTAGSSHIITATSRLETILKANKIPFRALDCATDEKARMLWGRRARGRKLPGLVKYGSVIGDLDQIEEWNEYGELKEQIDASQEFGNLTVPSNPPHEKSPSDTPQSEPSSRAASQTRHISISDPKDKEYEKDKDTSDSNPADSLKSTESPMTMAMRQAGAEAAAKASQKKSSGGGELKAAPAPVQESNLTAKTPTVASTKLNAGVDDPNSSAEATAAKTPAQLVAEGARRTSVDKISDPDSSGSTSPLNEASSSSTEEQLLDLRRGSSTTKTKSKLSESISVNKSETSVQDTSEPLTDVKTDEDSEKKSSRVHRGSSIEEASIEEIRAMEEKNRIQEEDEDQDDDKAAEKVASSTTTSGNAAAASTTAKSETTEVPKPQEKDAKDIEATGVSVGD